MEFFYPAEWPGLSLGLAYETEAGDMYSPPPVPSPSEGQLPPLPARKSPTKGGGSVELQAALNAVTRRADVARRQLAVLQQAPGPKMARTSDSSAILPKTDQLFC